MMVMMMLMMMMIMMMMLMADPSRHLVGARFPVMQVQNYGGKTH